MANPESYLAEMMPLLANFEEGVAQLLVRDARCDEGDIATARQMIA